MTVEPSNIKSIFLAASEKLPADRAKFLDQVTAGDAALRARVEALLKAHDNPDSFLKQAAAEFGATLDLTPEEAPLAERPGTVIGPYKLLRQIGEGGMGVVFMAEQTEPIQRTIALKIIKPGMDTRQVIARFEAERQALAMMDHPNIAKVLDAGTTDTGRPYFVMELVNGVPITQFCDKKHLALRERLELMLPVCQAVQHAHQKGIIHRDIKPTNVLVAEYDNRAVPKVIDFGVAKATAQKLTERTMFTEYGQLVGTFEYMSPEQARFNQLNVDTRGDIYSLGVLLYELLTGSTPLEKERLRAAAYDEILRIISEEDPPQPSLRLSSSQSLPTIAANRNLEPKKLTGLISGELDWIVMKCLEKDRNRRYETANALATDLTRHLNDESIEARPATRAYRLKKFVRRNRSAVLAGFAVVTTLALGLVLSSIGFVQARHQAQIARTESAQSAKMTQRATLVQNFLREMLTSANPEAQVGAAFTVQQLLDQAGDSIDKSFENQPDVRAVLHETIGETYYGLQLYAQAMKHLQIGVELRRRYLPDEKLALATALLNLAKAETVLATKLDDALSNSREAGVIFALELPENDLRIGYARALEAHLAGTAAGSSADELLITTRLPLLTILPDETLARMPAGLARAVAEAKRLQRAGDSAGAAAALRGYQLAVMEKVKKYSAAGDRAALQQFLHEHVAPIIEVPWARLVVPLGVISRAQFMRDHGADPLFVEVALQEAIDTGHEVWGKEHPHIALALHELAALLRDQGRLGEAESAARQAFDMRQKLLGSENPETTKSRDLLIEILEKEGKTAEAEKLRHEATILKSRSRISLQRLSLPQRH